MDLETTQNNAIAKLPLLKQGDYEMWKLRIEQYFQVQDYALWNSNSRTRCIEYFRYFQAKIHLNPFSFRLQKIVSQLAILGWNKLDLSTISFDDLYNNFKIVEQEVKRSVTSSSNSSSQNVAFVSTPGSTNEDNTANVQDSTASTHVNTASTNNSTASLSDATVYAFLANQPNGSQVVHEDLEQIHEDDLEEMDLKWQLALLSLKARKFYQRTGKKIIINGSDTAGYDKSKVECFNCHKMGHFARECRGPRNQENRPRNQESRHRNQESEKRTMNVEDTSSKAMVAFDGAGFDWSFMADEEVPTNLALMAFSDSEVYNHKTCSDTCLKSYETLKSQYDSLRVELNKSEFDLATYKRGLASVEEQLVFYKKNEVMLCDQIAVLKRDASFRDSEINALNIQIEKLKKEKESNQIKIDKFENASKSLDKLIGSQISDNNRKGVGYNAVPPPPTGLFAPPTIDLSSSGLKEFQQPEFEGYGVNVNKSVSENSSNEIKKTWCPILKMVQKPVINNVQKGTGQREVRPVWNNALRTNHQKISLFRREYFAQSAVLTCMAIVPISTVRQRSSRAAAPLAARPINTDAPKLFGDPHFALKDTGIFDSGCSRHMIGNKSYLSDYQDYDGGFVAFAGSAKGGKITGKETECLILSLDFKLPDENQVMLKIPRKDNMYSFDLKNVVPSKVLLRGGRLLGGKLRGGDLGLGMEDVVPPGVKCDNGTEFKNYDMNQFCGIKGIKREFSNARTPQQNGVAERKNRTLIEAARTMLADSLLPIPFWAEVVNTACYVQNRRPLGCPFTFLTPLESLGKFDGKADKGFLVSYSINSKAFRVFNSRTRKVEENLHVNFLENKPNVAGSGPEWLFDIDTLTNSMNYHPVSAGNRTNGNAGLETNSNAGQAGKENVPDQEYILLPLLHTSSNVPSNSEKDESSPKDDVGKMNEVKDSAKEDNMNGPGEATNIDSTNRLNTDSSPVNTVSSPVNTVSLSFTTVDPGRAKEQRNEYESLFDPLIPDLEDTADLQDTGIFGSAYDDEYMGAEADLSNL
ncbi:putative ribonuclease H-like domain-containing protein [Tanacetum coccineum]